ncbi:MAG: hypothetical protein KC983_00910 [Phycisphaerales bacterium]|nr:hypothetical protein [Phycisphaerales bacterium]
MLTRRQQRSVASFLLFLAPVVGLKVAAMMLGGPVKSYAEVTHGLEPPIVYQAQPVPDPTPRLQAAIDRAHTLQSELFAGSPMFFNAPPEEVQPVGPAVVVVDERIGFTVQAVMGSGATAIVMVDGKMYRPGEVVHDSLWKIVSIDNATRTVTIAHRETGTERQITVNKLQTGQ